MDLKCRSNYGSQCTVEPRTQVKICISDMILTTRGPSTHCRHGAENNKGWCEECHADLGFPLYAEV